jgi:hypothetical protein
MMKRSLLVPVLLNFAEWSFSATPLGLLRGQESSSEKAPNQDLIRALAK